MSDRVSVGPVSGRQNLPGVSVHHTLASSPRQAKTFQRALGNWPLDAIDLGEEMTTKVNLFGKKRDRVEEVRLSKFKDPDNDWDVIFVDPIIK